MELPDFFIIFFLVLTSAWIYKLNDSSIYQFKNIAYVYTGISVLGLIMSIILKIIG